MTSDDRFARALGVVEGISVGDAFGECFFVEESEALERITQRRLPGARWRWTDDTAMALSVLGVLERFETIDQDRLAQSFGRTYRAEPARGYGAAMHGLLARYVSGGEWRSLARAQFHGQGSFGNGAAMRVGPVGAYFADDLERVAAEAEASAVTTHAHPEGVAGAVAVAIACALAAGDPKLASETMIDAVAGRVPESEVKRRLAIAASLPRDTSVAEATNALGNGSEVTAQDTVAFSVWCAAHNIDDFEDALWLTVSGLGDRDTTCAITGAIVAARVGAGGIPPEWLRHREPLPRFAS